MSKRLISSLIVLMSISLLGIIAVQILWIRNAISIEEKNFNSNINKALHSIVNHLEKNEDVYFLTKALPENSHKKIENIEIREIKHFLGSGKTKGQNVFRIKSNKSIHANSEHNSNIDSKIIVMHSDSGRIDLWHPMHDVDSNMSIDIQIETKDTLHRLLRTEKRIEKIVDKVLVEFKNKDASIIERINLEKLPSLIQEELKTYNISSNFNFAIFSGDSLKLIHSSDSNFNEILKNTPHKINLFPNDIIYTNQILSIDFIDKFNLMYKPIFPLLLLSGIFIFFIIVTFVNSVVLILKQKRISDIKSDFINNITHEFKTPIATIGLASDSINNPKIIGNPDKVRYFTGIIKDENIRMNKQVENILQLSLFDKHEIELNLQSNHINEIILKAAEHIQLQLDEKGGKITTHLKALKDYSDIDEVHFLNVLFNVLDNAIKYSKNDPKIEITTVNRDHTICITIADSGIGMNSKTLKRVFKKFFRAQSGNIHDVKGFGLGLSYVKFVVDRHHGKIKITSKPDHGTSVQIILPVKQT